MATNTYVALDKKTVTSAVSSIEFTGISQGYTDLILVFNGGSTANADLQMRVGNGSVDTAANYSRTWLTGYSTSVGSDKAANVTYMRVSQSGYLTTSLSNTTIMQFSNYSSTNTHKMVLSRANNASTGVDIISNRWSSNSAITNIYLYPDGSTFLAGSTFSLYGIKAWAAETTPKATGGYVYSDSTYWYHAFPFSSTFTPNQSITADVLVVAGGGGGAHGGGGAGGVAYYASQSLTATGYTCTIGAGGTGGPASHATRGTSGANSQFGSLTIADGGGAGGQGAVGHATGLTGGSGGGGAPAGGTNAGGAALGSQGYAGGGSGAASGTYSAGGGGGAGAVGATGNSSGGLGGAGGVGTSTYSSWGVATNFGHNVAGTYFLAGGGSGGSDGGITPGSNGGGGQGSVGATTPGRVSTGAGGGGSSNVAGSAGGSGIIIVRYAK